ncbi:MAG: hypothetical protein D6773_17580 [Alphaproteobacteria bacterium]|nr:MAG: hypothetical protein D6773_17580 [Alphaproteobacteria bacterium]
MTRHQLYVLSLCDRTGVMVKPWANAGFSCLCVDIKHDGIIERDGIVFIGADVLDYLPPRVEYAAAFAFPPCTNTAVSGARWFKDKGLIGLDRSVRIVDRCRAILEWCECPWALEQPVSVISSYWRSPDHTFNPCDFGGYLDPPGDAYTKKTCLWVGGGFVMSDQRPVDPIEGSRMHRMAPGPTRSDDRAVTPAGFARAVYKANAT